MKPDKIIKPTSKSREQTHHVLSKSTVHVGPIPSSDELSKYEAIKPGFAERLIEMAENEQKVRLKIFVSKADMEIEESRKSSFRLLLGLVFGFLLVLGWIGLCGYMVWTGNPTQAQWTASFVVGLAGIFVLQRNFSKSSQNENKPEIDSEQEKK